MKAKDYEFTNEEIRNIEAHRDKTKDIESKIRLIAMLMLEQNDPIYVAQIIGVVPLTIENWFQKYFKGGVNELTARDYKPKKSILNFFQINQVVIWVRFNNPETVKEVMDYISRKFNVAYCVENVRQLLIKRGLKIIQPKEVPGNPPSVEEQIQFIEQYQQKKMTSEPGSKFLFVDAMHLIHQNLKGPCWGDPAFPPILETNSSRKRLNILGAYDPETHSLIHLTGEENCNADRVIEFFDKIIRTSHSAPKICTIVDNAKYFHALKVREWLEENDKLECIFLPSYSPNLNLIERFWKFAKKELVKRKYYKHYKTFRATVFQFLNNIEEYKDKLKSLMVEKFQIVYA
jgi:transposase